MDTYNHQVALLLKVLPEVAKEECFALHGGTAINLFVRNMPRLSVDVDLTYIPLEDRKASFEHINAALHNIKERIKKVDDTLIVVLQTDKLKLQIQDAKASIKIEVNQGMRGVFDDVEKRELCERAEEQFNAFCVVPCVPFHQLYGGKICAALDRQHPRDLFDVKYLLENEMFTGKIKTGFLFSLLSSRRPIIELLYPRFIDQRQAYKNQFIGMTREVFSYADFDSTRIKLLEAVHKVLTENDKHFIVDFENATPNWSSYNFSQFPAVKWKLQNIEKLKAKNPEKHDEGIKDLKIRLKLSRKD